MTVWREKKGVPTRSSKLSGHLSWPSNVSRVKPCPGTAAPERNLGIKNTPSFFRTEDSVATLYLQAGRAESKVPHLYLSNLINDISSTLRFFFPLLSLAHFHSRAAGSVVAERGVASLDTDDSIRVPGERHG